MAQTKQRRAKQGKAGAASAKPVIEGTHFTVIEPGEPAGSKIKYIARCAFDNYQSAQKVRATAVREVTEYVRANHADKL